MKAIIVTQYLAVVALQLLVASFVAAEPTLPPLRESRDVELQRGLERSLAHLGLRQAVARKDLAVALVDITDIAQPSLATVNGDEMMYAASLPKIAILLGAFERIAEGRLSLDADTQGKLTSMIRNSSNQAATEMLNRVGKPYLARVLQSPRYRFYDPEHNGGLWVGKDYGKAGAWKRDPLHSLSHGATAVQTARFYYLLEAGHLVSASACRDMKEMLGEPAIRHKFVKGLQESRPGSRIFRKSGTWRNWHADSAIVERDGRRYIAVALAHSSQGSKWLSKLIVALDDLIFESAPTRVAQLDDAGVR